MNQDLECILQGLACSNFYISGPEKLKVTVDGITVHLGPHEGILEFECGDGATAYTVACINSKTPGRITVHPPLKLKSSYTYIIHQTPQTFPEADVKVISMAEYQALAGRR